MRARLVPWLLVALTSVGGAAGCISKQDRLKIEPTPAWKTEEGRKNAWRELAHWYIDNDLPAEALEMVQRLREAGEDTPQLRTIQGRALSAQGVPEEARVVLEEVVDRFPREIDAWSALGITYIDLGMHEHAIEALRRSLKLAPDDAATRNNLGFVLLGLERCDEAVTELEAVVAADATSARYRNNLAFALVCQGDHERALKLFRSTGTEVDARYNMGLALERLDKVPSALLQYRQALNIDPDYEKAAEAIARLATDDSPVLPGAE